MIGFVNPQTLVENPLKFFIISTATLPYPSFDSLSWRSEVRLFHFPCFCDVAKSILGLGLNLTALYEVIFGSLLKKSRTI